MTIGEEIARGFWGCVLLVALAGMLLGGAIVFACEHSPWRVKVERTHG